MKDKNGFELMVGDKVQTFSCNFATITEFRDAGTENETALVQNDKGTWGGLYPEEITFVYRDLSDAQLFAKLALLMEEYPRLSDFGMGVFDEKRIPKNESEEMLKKDRKDLLARASDVAWVTHFLANAQMSQRINTRHSTYGMKHMIERRTPNGYITNGVFIAAALLAGFRISKDEPNPRINIAESTIKEWQREQMRLEDWRK